MGGDLSNSTMGCLLLSFNEISPDGQDPDWQEAINGYFKPLPGRETSTLTTWPHSHTDTKSNYVSQQPTTLRLQNLLCNISSCLEMVLLWYGDGLQIEKALK